MERDACQDLEDPLLRVLEILDGHNKVLEGILKSNLRFMQALKPFLDLLKRMLFLQDRALLLLEIQLLGVMVYALWRIYKAVMRK